MSRPVDLIVPDSGPLISLAHANRLDLLDVFDRPVIVLDVVRAECLKKPDSPDHDRLRRWFNERRNRISIAESPIGPVYEAKLAEERSGRDPHATRGLGDASIVWLTANIGRVAARGAIPLVLVVALFVQTGPERPLSAWQLVIVPAVAVVTTLTLNNVYAAQQPEVIRLDTIYVTAHKDATDANGNMKVTRLDTIVVTAHKNIA